MAGRRSPAGLEHSIIDAPAYQEMLLALAELHQRRGDSLTVDAIDDFETDTPRDNAMATQLQTYLATGKYDRSVVFVDNLHAIRQAAYASRLMRQYATVFPDQLSIT